MRLRPSGLSVSFACPGSIDLPESERASDAGEAGSLRHRWLSERPHLALNTLGISGVCVIEQPVKLQGISGTPDLVIEGDDGDVTLVDWKTSGADLGNPANVVQMQFYATAVRANRIVIIYVEPAGDGGECRVTYFRDAPWRAEDSGSFNL